VLAADLPHLERPPEGDDYLLYPVRKPACGKGSEGQLLRAYLAEPKKRPSPQSVHRWWYRHAQAAGLVGPGVKSGLNMHRARIRLRWSYAGSPGLRPRRTRSATLTSTRRSAYMDTSTGATWSTRCSVTRAGLPITTPGQVFLLKISRNPNEFGRLWRRRESNPRPRSREDGFYERSRRSCLVLRSPRRRGHEGPAS
jgi:hypothetical protein